MSADAPRSEAISPTAHYTGAVWTRHGLSHPALATTTGQLMLHSLRPLMLANRLAGGPTLEGYLIARHVTIDRLLEEAIEHGAVSQVIEIACGLSPRGWRFAARHGERLTYVEADLPDMAARKRKALEQTGTLGEHHRVVDIDALRDDGAESLPAVAADLDPARGTAIITEGLLTYLDGAAVAGLWERVAAVLGRFPHGLYLSDLHLQAETNGVVAAAFLYALGLFVGGRVEMHYDDVAHATAALTGAGFADVALHRPGESHDLPGLRDADAQMVRIIEART